MQLQSRNKKYKYIIIFYKFTKNKNYIIAKQKILLSKKYMKIIFLNNLQYFKKFVDRIQILTD